MNNDEKVKEMLEKEPVPQELEPENIKAMLDQKAPQKKRSGISVGGRLAAAAAAFAVIGGGSYAYLSAKPSRVTAPISESVIETTTLPKVEQTTELFSQKAYMSGASDYSQIYELMKLSAKNNERQSRMYKGNADYTFDTAEEIMPNAEVEAEEEGFDDSAAAVQSSAGEENSAVDYQIPEDNAGGADIGGEVSAEEEFVGGMGGEDENVEFSDTHDQEQNVLEADIVKTDGKYIYYISSAINGEDGSVLRSAEVKDGKFLSGHTTSVNIPSFYENADYSGSYVEDMYLTMT